FVSYATEDKTTADAVVANLEHHQIRCWIAPRDVPPGQSYAEVIVDAISEARVMVLVFSAHANDSPHVMREVERAVHKGVMIVPLRIQDVMPSRSFEFFISGTHWLDAMTPPLQGHLDRLTETVQRILGRPRTVRKQAAAGYGGGRPPASGIGALFGRWRDNPLLLFATGGGVIAVVAAIGLYMSFADNDGGADSPETATVTAQPPERTVIINGQGFTCAEVTGVTSPDCGPKSQPVFDEFGQNIDAFVNAGRLGPYFSDAPYEDVAYAGIIACTFWAEGQDSDGQNPHPREDEQAYIDYMNEQPDFQHLDFYDLLPVWFQAKYELCPD
ncbi:MAG TPA: toll/interleukin-1 receptor domain-containing protein, partial [Dehalococcoidia bacterium]|nr:toll/interleukin-1 receptor domain-containing protein [Dehalococcoidia bacterium]